MPRSINTAGLMVAIVLTILVPLSLPCVARADDGWRKTAIGWEQSALWAAGPMSPRTDPVAVPLGFGAVHPLPFAFAQLFCIAAAFVFVSRRDLIPSDQTDPSGPC